MGVICNVYAETAGKHYLRAFSKHLHLPHYVTAPGFSLVAYVQSAYFIRVRKMDLPRHI